MLSRREVLKEINKIEEQISKWQQELNLDDWDSNTLIYTIRKMRYEQMDLWDQLFELGGNEHEIV